MDITSHAAWRTLNELRAAAPDVKLTSLFNADAERAARFSASAPHLFLDYSKTHLTDEIKKALLRLAEEAGVPAAIEAMFDGARINTTEARAAMHFALRRSPDRPLVVDGEDIGALVQETGARLARCARSIRTGDWRGASGKPIREVVHIGIGGSALGPQMALEALGSYRSGGIGCHFVANVDGEELADVLATIDAAETLIILVSKSFTTLETRLNGEAAQRWLRASGVEENELGQHLVAITANVAAARASGIPTAHIFPMWDWVGGRYSLWSSVGLVLAIALGPDLVEEFHRGAEEMDEHFRQTPLAGNLPVLMALIGIWYNNLCGAQSHAVVPYSHHLRLFPDFLQQLEMESNGKLVTHDGLPVTADTAPVIWGNEGSNSQHSFHQLLFQGSRLVPIDFILPLTTTRGDPQQHEWLVANCFSQSRALMVGRDLATTIAELSDQGMTPAQVEEAAPHRVIPGNRPSCTLLLERLDPRALGALIALYEHKVFAQGTIWNVNSFDQWGVELGKRLASEIHQALRTQPSSAVTLDGSTRAMVERYKKSYISTGE